MARFDATSDRNGTRHMKAVYWPFGPFRKFPGELTEELMDVQDLQKTDGFVDLGNACAFDTDEKWIEVFVPNPLRGADGKSFRIMVADGKAVKAKLYINYDIVDKRTGSVLYSVRQ